MHRLHQQLPQKNKNKQKKTLLAVQWLRLRASNAGGLGWITGWGTRIPHAMGHSKQQQQQQQQQQTQLPLRAIHSPRSSVSLGFFLLLNSIKCKGHTHPSQT